MNQSSEIAQLFDKISQMRPGGSTASEISRLMTLFGSDSNVRLLKRYMLSDNENVRKAAMWIASELPSKCEQLLDEAAVLSSDAEKYLRYYAMDVIMLGSRQNRSEMISCIARRLTDVDEFIAARAVELLARASETQLASSKVLFEAQNEIDHATGMSKITNSSAFNEDAIEAMMKSESVLERRYGLVAAKRAQKINSNLLKQAALSDDPVLARIGRAV